MSKENRNMFTISRANPFKKGQYARPNRGAMPLSTRTMSAVPTDISSSSYSYSQTDMPSLSRDFSSSQYQQPSTSTDTSVLSRDFTPRSVTQTPPMQPSIQPSFTQTPPVPVMSPTPTAPDTSFMITPEETTWITETRIVTPQPSGPPLVSTSISSTYPSVTVDIPTNAGPFLPDMFPYGIGGRPVAVANPRPKYVLSNPKNRHR